MAARELGWIVYRCRRCGQFDRSLSSPDVTETLVSVIHGLRNPNDRGIRGTLLSIHTCPDGATGVTDIVGGEREDWVPPPAKVLPPPPKWPLR